MTDTTGGDYAAFTRYVAHREDTQLPYLRIIEDEHADTVKMPRCWLLDAPSDPNPILDGLMRDALQGIYLSADGATARLVERVSSGTSAGSIAPTSSNAGDLSALEHAYATSRTHRRRLALIKEAQTLRVRLAYAPNRSKVKGTPEWKRAICEDTRSTRTLEYVYGIGKSTVARIKKEGVPRVAVIATVSHTSQSRVASR